MRFRLRLTGLKRSAPSCKHGSHPFFNPAPCLLQVLESPPSQLAVGNCIYSEWHLDIGKLCFIFTKILCIFPNGIWILKNLCSTFTRILCILVKQQIIDIDSYFVEGIRNRELRHPRRVSHNTLDTVGIERVFCHNLIDEVKQRFAAYYPGRKTQRERSATTVSAGVMRILSCRSHNQPAEVEEKSCPPAFFYGIYSVANLVCFYILRFYTIPV